MNIPLSLLVPMIFVVRAQGLTPSQTTVISLAGLSRVYLYKPNIALTIPERSGVDTGENIIQGAMEAVNMERDFVAAFVALGIVSTTFND